MKNKMALTPPPPFVWPEPRVIEQICNYDNHPPYAQLAIEARSLFGIVSALTGPGVDVLASWFERNPDLQACLVVIVYPACPTKQQDFAHLTGLVERTAGRLLVHVYALEQTTDRGTNALCFLGSKSDNVHLITGPTEDLGLNSKRAGQVNFAFLGDPVLVEGFKRYFDFLWANSRDITVGGTADIPNLTLRKGTEEGAQMWRDYMNYIASTNAPQVAQVDGVTGDVTITEEGQGVVSPTETLGFVKLDQLAEQVARLYSKGTLVSIDKMSRIPPLDAPLDPKLFGDAAEMRKGNVTRKVSMRVSVIDEKTLKNIESRRQGIRTLLTKFTFGLADNVRWMPTTARGLFERELNRLNDEGQKLISDLLKGDVGAFMKAKRGELVANINAMYVELGKPGPVSDDIITQVSADLTDRLTKAQSANFLPRLSCSLLSFVRTENAAVSPWGQAFSLLSNVTAFPREALTDSFFFRGLKVEEDELIEAMNVTDDALCRDLRTRGIKDRCNEELELLSKIEKASVESRDRCELVFRILNGDSTEAIHQSIKEKESAMNETLRKSAMKGK